MSLLALRLHLPRTTQIKGVDSTKRTTRAEMKAGASFVVKEKLYTHGEQFADTDFVVDMNGANCRADIMSRSVAAENSVQRFVSTMNGNAPCYGHTECDAIIMDNACVTAASLNVIGPLNGLAIPAFAVLPQPAATTSCVPLRPVIVTIFVRAVSNLNETVPET